MEQTTANRIFTDSEVLLKLIVELGMGLLGGILALIVGFWLVGRLKAGLMRIMERRNVDPSLRTFLRSFLSIALKILVIITVLSMVGVQMTSFIAMLGAAGLAVGLALQGTLQNVAGGVIILLFKTLRVGDVIESGSYIGTVREIQMMYTLLTTFDNRVVTIPNSALATGSLINYSKMPERRVDWVFSIAYGDDYGKAEQVLRELIEADDRILAEPEPFIALQKLNNSSVDIVVRCWTKSENYWPVFFNMNRKVYETFAAQGLTIPFPQMDVYVHSNN
ncbi:MAG: mechanosensitive ion channel [Bacteroidia bacterium]|jgi:small conductance mechanosensitive channel|nr:mechanosensitive ion channel [Bacteroidia bacterium]